MNSTEKLLKKIVLIIFLTNIPAVLSLPIFFSGSIGWILGSVASATYLIWLAHDVKKCLQAHIGKAKVAAMKGYFFRYLFLIVYSILVVLLVKPDILLYGFGLLSGQLAIYLHVFWEWMRKNKYFRG